MEAAGVVDWNFEHWCLERGSWLDIGGDEAFV